MHGEGLRLYDGDKLGRSRYRVTRAAAKDVGYKAARARAAAKAGSGDLCKGRGRIGCGGVQYRRTLG